MTAHRKVQSWTPRGFVDSGWCHRSSDYAVASLRWWCIWVFVLAKWAPDRRYQVVFCCLAVSNQAGAGFADTNTRTSEVVPEPLVVLCETTKLELRHRLLVWSVHDEKSVGGEVVELGDAGGVIRKERGC